MLPIHDSLFKHTHAPTRSGYGVLYYKSKCMRTPQKSASMIRKGFKPASPKPEELNSLFGAQAVVYHIDRHSQLYRCPPLTKREALSPLCSGYSFSVVFLADAHFCLTPLVKSGASGKSGEICYATISVSVRKCRPAAVTVVDAPVEIKVACRERLYALGV